MIEEIKKISPIIDADLLAIAVEITKLDLCQDSIEKLLTLYNERVKLLENDITKLIFNLELLKYKNAWEELKDMLLGEDEEGDNVYFKSDGTMEELEQKYNLDKE